MPRLQIELTSTRPDGAWTWRVAGARQPKGVVAAALIPTGSRVGDILRVEADVELEGTTVTAVLGAPPKKREREHLEMLVDDQPFEPVTTSLVPKGARPRRSTWDGGGERAPRSGSGATRRAGRPARRPGRVTGRPRRSAARPRRRTAPRIRQRLTGCARLGPDATARGGQTPQRSSPPRPAAPGRPCSRDRPRRGRR